MRYPREVRAAPPASNEPPRGLAGEVRLAQWSPDMNRLTWQDAAA
ncbi:MAG: hypothetical protein ACRDPK_01045 [Carbonactinosporaceae bacterium]